MNRKIAFIALLTTLALSGLAMGGDRTASKDDRCGAGSCPMPCGSCSASSAASCPMESAMAAMGCSNSR